MKIPKFEAPTEWLKPTEFPDLRDVDEIAIDLETKDPDLLKKGSGSVIGNGEELNKPPRVKLSTIHSAKGGEANNVLLILDNTKTIRDAVEKSLDKQDEEHRVWYVGVTRTKQNLYIMAAKKEDQGYDIESLG